MPRYYDTKEGKGCGGLECLFAQLGIRMEHHVRRRCDASHDVDFIVVGGYAGRYGQSSPLSSVYARTLAS